MTPHNLNGAATGYKLETTEGTKVGLEVVAAVLNQHFPCRFAYGNNRVIVLSGEIKWTQYTNCFGIACRRVI